MEHIFTYPREDFEAGKLTYLEVESLVESHRSLAVPTMEHLLEYYLGHHQIEQEDRGSGNPNAQPVCNHAKDIADVASGYFLGSPIAYKGVETEEREGDEDDKVRTLKLKLKRADASEVDQDNALQESIFGLSYEYIYREEGSKELKIKSLSPMQTFIVVDDTIEHRKLFGVNYYKKVNDADHTADPEWFITLATATEIRYYRTGNGDKYRKYEHNLGGVPIIEYRNNKYGIGDYEQQIGLIDCYNTLMAQRVNDKEQFVDSILAIYGALLGDDADKSAEALKELQDKKLIELPEDAKAEYLTHTLDEQGAEVLRKAIKQDIYTFSHVPNLADENFAGNSSGVAMEYKLLGLEMLTKIKESWYRRGLSERLTIFLHDLAINQIFLEETDIEIGFSRALPKNILELSQIIVNLDGKVSDKTLLQQIPFVEDPDAEIDALKLQQEEESRRQMALEGFTYSEPLDVEVVDE